MKVRKKPVVVDATQWNGGITGVRAIEAMYPGLRTVQLTTYNREVTYWAIATLEGRHVVSVGDRIIKGVKGEFYPCKPDVFELTYEVIE